MDLLKEIFEFVVRRKKLWLLPIMVFLFAVGGLSLLVKGTVIAPFIYTVF